MPSGKDASASAAYRPTSLDFINLPNPIEPSQQHAASQKHPLNGTPRDNNNPAKQDLFKLILEPSSERPPKRQKHSDSTLDLPLPVRNAAKRPRIPPTLSGLHQPPPDAGLLPSISTEQPQIPPPRQQDATSQEPVAKALPEKSDAPEAAAISKHALASASEKLSKTSQKRPKRNKWTENETECLLKGVARFGIGNWTKILNCPDYHFNSRTALDLKDRFRVCCPDNYKTTSAKSKPRVPSGTFINERQPIKLNLNRGPQPERVTPSKLKALGIDEPFVKTGRRARHGYTSAEDEAILRGFKKYGNSWAAIKQDPDLGLSNRTATDLRDRCRTRFPKEYGKAGLTVRQEKPTIAKRVDDASELPATSDGEGGSEAPKTTAPIPTSSMPDIINKEEPPASKAPAPRRPPQPSLFSLDDVFLGVPFGDDEADSEPIVLDRGILDWASADTAKNSSKNTGIDPRMTLKLPKPVSSIPTSAPVGLPGNSTTLPSLATLLPDNMNSDQLELPSLLQMFGSMDNDGRNGGTNFQSLEDLLG